MSAPHPSLVRLWARRQGLDVPARGRLPAPLLAAYEAAHAGELPETASVLRQELAQAATRTQRTRTGYGYVWRQFGRWCRAHDRNALPANEDLVLAYLHAHADRWGWGTMYQHANAISYQHAQAGHPNPCGPAVADYLAATSRTRGRVTELHRVDALLGEHAAQIAASALPVRHTLRPHAQRSELALLLVRATGQPLRTFTRLRVDEVTLDEDGAHLGGAADLRVERVTGPYCPVAALARMIALLPDDATLVFGVLGSRSKDTPVWAEHDGTRAHAATVQGVRQVFQRTGAMECWSSDRPGELLDTAAFARAVEMCNPSFLLELRARAYMLVGLSAARRHDELEHADIEHFTLDDDGQGYSWLIPRSKSDQAGAGMHCRVDHDVPHSSACPACALARWCDALARHCGYISGPLFPSLHVNSRPRRRLERGNALRILRNTVQSGGVELDRVGTRSLRAGAATTLTRDQGLGAAQAITQHASVATLLKYVRQQDPFIGQYQLDI